MKSDFEYYMPTKIKYGCGASQCVSDIIGGRKTLLVTTEGTLRRGAIEKMIDRKHDVVGTIYGIQSHPDFDCLRIASEQASRYSYDLILAVGGGSVMDSAKFLSVRNKTGVFEFSHAKSVTMKTKNCADSVLTPIVSIPTTSGTSSEITPWATIWDTGYNTKRSLHLPGLFSEVALYDPLLTTGLPITMTVHSALDALSHAFESIWNRNATEITVAYAIRAAKMIVEYLPFLVEDLDNVFYRSKIMMASMYAGLAFSNTQTAIAHAMSYYFTLSKKIPHGLACSFLIPELIDRIIGKYQFVDSAINNILGELRSDKLRKIYSVLGISVDIASYDISDEELIQILEQVKKEPRFANSLVSY